MDRLGRRDGVHALALGLATIEVAVEFVEPAARNLDANAVATLFDEDEKKQAIASGRLPVAPAWRTTRRRSAWMTRTSRG